MAPDLWSLESLGRERYSHPALPGAGMDLNGKHWMSVGGNSQVTEPGQKAGSQQVGKGFVHTAFRAGAVGQSEGRGGGSFCLQVTCSLRCSQWVHLPRLMPHLPEIID